MQTFKNLFDILETSDFRHKYRLLSGAVKLASLSTIDSEVKNIRDQSFFKEYFGGKSPLDWETLNPVELWNTNGENSMFQIFMMDRGGNQRKVVSEIISFGKEHGLWDYFPGNPEATGFGDSFKGEYANPDRILPKGGWWVGEKIHLNLNDKRTKDAAKKIKRAEDVEKEAAQNQNTLREFDREWESVAKWPDADAIKPYAQDDQNRIRQFFCYTLREWDSLELIPAFATNKKTGEQLLARIYSRQNLTAKWISEHVTFESELTSKADAKAMHPALIAVMLEEEGISAPDFLKSSPELLVLGSGEQVTNSSHLKICRILGLKIECKTDIFPGKIINLSAWNRIIPGSDKFTDPWVEKFFQFMEQTHPEVLKALHQINARYKFTGKDGKTVPLHANMSRLLAHREVQVVSRALQTLGSQQIKATTRHDCLITKKSNALAAKAAFDEALDYYLVPTFAEVED